MPHVEYEQPKPVFIDFRIERNEALSKQQKVLLIQAFEKGKGLAGFSTKLGGWFLFTPTSYRKISEEESLDFAVLPQDWEQYAVFD